MQRCFSVFVRLVCFIETARRTLWLKYVSIMSSLIVHKYMSDRVSKVVFLRMHSHYVVFCPV